MDDQIQLFKIVLFMQHEQATKQKESFSSLDFIGNKLFENLEIETLETLIETLSLQGYVEMDSSLTSTFRLAHSSTSKYIH